MNQNNSLPKCNLCEGNSQSEWMVVYGKDPVYHYSFACTKHLGELIQSVSGGKHGQVVTFYAEHFTSGNSYDERWNSEWERHTIKCNQP